ncbi:hypothetical protein, partial [Klebsiella pneumoniae]|uniref:hypothetical protein n=3 Tax=Klebsiella pneumoniae TaxID=573 RepID=UPI001C6E0F74
LKMPAFEWVHVQLHQQKGMISLSPPTICNSAQKTMLAGKPPSFLPGLKDEVSPRHHGIWLHYFPRPRVAVCAAMLPPFALKTFTITY